MKLKPWMAGNGRLLFLMVTVLVLSVGLAGRLDTLVAQEPTLPPVIPDAAVGHDIFLDRCANCHGLTGQGDGALSSDLPAPPADYTDPEFRRSRLPGMMYNSITNGILESGMPPFGPENSEPVSEEDRWHVLATVYSLATPLEAVEAGRTVYEGNCAACHGETGLGDGPDAANAEAEMPDLTAARYWFNRSNEIVFEAVAGGGIPEHAYELTEQERWDVVDYARTFSYHYVNPNAPAELLEGARISGFVTNGTTSGVVSEGVEVLLRGFSQDFEPVVTVTTTVAADGSYLFELDPVDPDWVYLASARYHDLSFSSDVGQISPTEPELVLPIMVFESTTNPDAVVMDRIHVLLSFGQDTLQVDEFYVFSNPTVEVFVGESGVPAAGTVRFTLPEGAQNINFQRSFASMQSLMPATEVIQLENGIYADTLPLNPGETELNLIVSYDLPFEEGMTVERPLLYNTLEANIIIPGEGVTLAGDGWVDQGVQEMPGGSFSSYIKSNMVAGDDFSFELNGRPSLILDEAGNMLPVQNNSTNELIVGGAVLLIVVVGAWFVLNRYLTGDNYAENVESEQEEIDRLLLAVVDLDDAFEAGRVDKAAYQEQRQKLIGELAAMWPSHQS
ncbi:MAG: hypothetical protein CSA11_06830 [Chloroflexi bacterium]|nr:MAG: hypothetical protein CSA11_06830 [Chloroflexota bacterium]